MWLPLNLEINNLASHKSTKYTFLEGKARLIQGENRDDRGQKSNGSGKSIAPEAMVLAITGESFRKASGVELIRDGEDSTNIVLELENRVHGLTMKISRSFYLTKSQKVELTVNNIPKKYSSTAETTKAILEYIGISKEDLLNYFLIHKSKFKPFFIIGDTDKKLIINRFSGADLIKGIDKVIEKSLEEDKSKQTSLNSLITIHEAKIQVYEDQIKEKGNTELEKERRANQISLIIIDIEKEEKEINQHKLNNIDLQNEINKFDENTKTESNKLDLLRTQLSEIKVDENNKELENYILERNDQIGIKSNILEAQKDKNKDISEVSLKISNLEKKLIDKICCPQCAHEFSLKDKGFNIVKAKEELRLLNIELDEYNLGLKEINGDLELTEKEIKVLDVKIKEIEDQININRKSKKLKQEEIDNIESKIRVNNNNSRIKEETIDKNQKLIDNLEKSIQSNLTKIEEIENKPFDEIDNTEENKKIEQFQKLNEEHKVELLVLEDKIYKANVWIYNFQKFNTFLANQAISTIEGYTNLYLEEMKSNMTVLIDGYKYLADGKTLRENIDINISKDGSGKFTFGRLSSGEAIRPIIANIIALQKLINLNSPYGGLGYLCLDEVIESVDEEGVKHIIQTLNKIGQTIDIITHTTHNINDVDVLWFIKENGITTTKEKNESIRN